MKILFVHIPKTGGMSTQSYLTDNHSKFLNYTYNSESFSDGYFCHRFLKYEIDNYLDYFKFTIIRNPNDRIISMYTYIKKGMREGPPASLLWDRLPDNILETFDSFISNFKKFYYEKIYPDYSNLKYINFNVNNVSDNENVIFYPQSWHITDNSNNILVDKLIKLDKIDSELKNIFGTGNVPKIIKEIYKDDFNLYNKLD